MSSTNHQSPQPSADDSPVFEMPAYHVGDRCPECQLGNKITHLINKGQKLVCPACWWNTKNRNYTVPTGTVCANVNCSKYDEHAEKLMQWCCKACEPAAVDDLPRQVLSRATSMDVAIAFEAGLPICCVAGCIAVPLPGLEICAIHFDEAELERLHATEVKDSPCCQYKTIDGHPACALPAAPGSEVCERHTTQAIFRESRKALEESGFGDHPAYQAPGHPPQMDIGNGRTTKCPDYHLIPPIALQRIAERFELGEIRKGNKAWNANSPYQDVLTEKAFILVRLSHVIDHANKMMDEVRTGVLSDDDNAGAIGWAGCFLSCVREKMKELQDASRKTTISEQPTTSLTGDADEVVARWLELVASNNTADPVHRAAAQQLYAHMYSPSKADQPVPPASDVVRSQG